ncbi:MAG: TasA family protein [Chloroflexota bacterium]
MLKYLAIAIFAVGIMSVGVQLTTQALFTDSETVGSNTFTAGTLDLSTSEASEVLSLDPMAPGDTATSSLTVANEGNLELRYALSSTSTPTGPDDDDDLTVASTTELSIWAESEEGDDDSTCDASFSGSFLYGPDTISGAGFGDIDNGDTDDGDRLLAPDANEVLCFKVHMDLSAGNEWQGEGAKVSFTFDAEQTDNNPS